MNVWNHIFFYKNPHCLWNRRIAKYSAGLFLIQKRKWDVKKIWKLKKKTKGVPHNINTLCKNTCIKFFIVRFSFIFVRKNRLTLHTNKFRCLHLCKSRLNTIHEKGKTLSFSPCPTLVSPLRSFLRWKKRKSSTRTLIARSDRFSRNVHQFFPLQSMILTKFETCPVDVLK